MCEREERLSVATVSKKVDWSSGMLSVVVVWASWVAVWVRVSVAWWRE